VKPAQFIDNERTRLKAEAARAHCTQVGISIYRLLVREDLESMGILERR
jgi:hypothetical protein